MLPKLDAENIDYTFEIQNGGHDWNTWRGALQHLLKISYGIKKILNIV